MKKIIVVLIAIILGIGAFSACATHSKCPAYGHYTQSSVEQVDSQSL